MIKRYVAFETFNDGVRLATAYPGILAKLRQGGVRHVAFQANCREAAARFAELWGAS